jgi:hypothetical protein
MMRENIAEDVFNVHVDRKRGILFATWIEKNVMKALIVPTTHALSLVIVETRRLTECQILRDVFPRAEVMSTANNVTGTEWIS